MINRSPLRSRILTYLKKIKLIRRQTRRRKNMILMKIQKIKNSNNKKIKKRISRKWF
jgi:hypothetical protein